MTKDMEEDYLWYKNLINLVASTNTDNFKEGSFMTPAYDSNLRFIENLSPVAGDIGITKNKDVFRHDGYNWKLFIDHKSIIQSDSENPYPLDEEHICFKRGHTMYSVFTLHNHQSSWGRHKCSRCGYEEDWQYDFISSNPMYNQNQVR